MPSQLDDHLVPTEEPNVHPLNGPLTKLDHVVVAGRTFDALTFNINPTGDIDYNILGYGFLSRLGVVGFNLRRHQLIFYH